MNGLGSTLQKEFADQEATFLQELEVHRARTANAELLLELPQKKSPKRSGRILAGKRAIEDLFPSWHELLRTASSAEFYHQPEWFSALLPMLNDEDVLVYVEKLEEELSVIVPLVRENFTFAGIPLKSISLLHNGYSPYTDYIAGNDAEAYGVMNRMTGALKDARIGWDLLYCPNVSPHSHVERDMQGTPHGLRVVQQKRVCDYFRTEPYEVTLKRFSTNFRGNLRKVRNKLEELPNVRYEWHRDPEGLRQAFPEFLQVEASGWKWLEGSSILQIPEARKFYENLIENFGPHGQCGIHLLKQENNILAGQFALYQGSVCSLLKIGYDEAFSKLAPGNMLLEALLKRHQGDDEIQEINLISGMEWHKNWKPLVMPISNYFQFNFNSRPLLAYSLYQGKKWTESLAGGAKETPVDEESAYSR